MLLKSCDKRQEEADWLAGDLSLPREASIAIKRRNLDDADAAQEYGVSLRVLTYRVSMIGVSRQFR